MAALGTFKPVTLTKKGSYLTIKPLAHSRIYIFLLYAPVKRAAFMFNPHLSCERLSNNLSLQLRLSVNTSRALHSRAHNKSHNNITEKQPVTNSRNNSSDEEDLTSDNDDIRKQTDEARASEQGDNIL